MKLYTRQGDDGSTGLFGGQRVSKGHLRVCAYGGVDELNCAIGLVVAGTQDQDFTSKLQAIQHDLFTLGGELATPGGAESKVMISDEDVARLESWIDHATDEVPELKNFIVPGGSETAARLHFARSVCRRAERDVVQIGESETVRGTVIRYLNRLSDLLFAMARVANRRDGLADIPWLSTPPPV